MNLTQREADLLAYAFGVSLPKAESEVHLLTMQSGRTWWITFWDGVYKVQEEL